MKKLFISQPMRGKTAEEIKTERELLIEKAKEQCGEVEVIDSYFENFDGNALQYLGKSIQLLGTANVAAFGAGWKDARGCKIEHICAKEYGIEIVEL